MTISEACQLWIEERCQQELAVRKENGKSLRAIGREIATEIVKYFEATVAPDTIRMRLSRMREQGGTFVPPMPNTLDDSGSQENKEISKGFTIDGKPRQRAAGGGRKPKYYEGEIGMELTEGDGEREVMMVDCLNDGTGRIRNKRLSMAFVELESALKRAKEKNWRNAPIITVQKRINRLYRLVRTE